MSVVTRKSQQAQRNRTQKPPSGMMFPRCGGSSPRQLDEAFELPDADGVAHFAEGLGFDLADALAGRYGTRPQGLQTGVGWY
ncbi:MAG: hypothetical protein H7A49_13380 [Akkermansiaceae bacterium]|nr:hypothetical protein [Akkermansiaceae bacterium]